MSDAQEAWYPGSFTKNFGWGERRDGLRQLHKAIRVGFEGEERDVPRAVFRRRLRAAGMGDFVPANFFLFNRPIHGTDHVIIDELVFQALTGPHSPRFDKLALFAFNFSYVGRWSRARDYQERPALWAFHYVRDRLATDLKWNVRRVSADDIEDFLVADPRYRGKTTRKVATNLNHLYHVGRLNEFADDKVSRWWVDALFLALDRLIESRSIRGANTSEGQYASLLGQSDFQAVSGRRSIEKELATKHLLRLYVECGARDRFSPEHVRERTALKVPELEWFIANDARPWGAVHPSNPNILKSIPRACAMLAKYVAGFETIDADELEAFDAAEFIRRQTQAALAHLRERHIQPSMSAEELMKLTRDA